MSETAEEIGRKADEAFTELKTLMDEIRESSGDGKDRLDGLTQKAEELGTQVAELQAAKAEAEATEAAQKRMSDLEARINDLAANTRAPSKASAVLGGGALRPDNVDTDAFFRTLAIATNPKAPTELRAQAEKALADMGSTWQGIPDYSKAVLGDTDAAGGYLAPRAVVAELSEVASASNPYRRMLNVITNVIGPTVEVPHLGLAPTRAVVVPRGETKTNVNISLANYTATFYTLAQIIDASNQWLRQTRGQGEAVIRKRLGEALALGESWYILNGDGTGEPKGLLTSLGTSGTFVTSHTAAQTTIAGNIASGLAKAAGDLANRNRTPDGAVMNAGDFWITLASGADAAGFYIAPSGGPASLNATGAFSNGQAAISIWGIPLLADPNMPADSLVVGQFKGADFYIGSDYRIDTSTEAGDRWDKNLTGFRAEEEIAFNADPYVSAGLFQRLIDTKA